MINRLRAWALGVRDGWRQPLDLSTSTNVDHLNDDHLNDVQDSQDRGINLGQLLRAGHRSQAARERWFRVWP